MEEDSVLIRKGESAVGNLLAVDVPEELTRQNLKSAANGEFWSYILDPTVELVANNWVSTAENQLNPKDIGVPNPAISITTDDGLCFRYDRIGKPGETTFGTGVFLSLFAYTYSLQQPVIMAVVDQLGGMASGAVITTEADGSAAPMGSLRYDHVRSGPNKDCIRYSFETKTHDKSGFYFDGVAPGVSVAIPFPPPAVLAAVMDGAGDDAEKLAAAEAIDWSKQVGTQWLMCVAVAPYLESVGAKVTFSPGVSKARFGLEQLYKTYADDPAYVAG